MGELSLQDRLRAYAIDDDAHGNVSYYKERAKTLREASEKIEAMRERLEIGFGFDANGNRVAIDNDKYDGIYCRDATIKLQDEQIDKHAAELAALAARVEELQTELDALREPERIVHCQRWYMRDNHTFAKLSDDNAEALSQLRDVFAGECGTYGMLCTTHRMANGKDGNLKGRKVLHHSGESWADYANKAQAWLAENSAALADAGRVG